MNDHDCAEVQGERSFSRGDFDEVVHAEIPLKHVG